MTFLYPEFIYMMLLPAGLLIYLITTNKDVVERVFSAQTLDRLRISGDALGRTGHNTLIFAAFFFMTIALARPVIEQGEERVQSRGVDLVVAFDEGFRFLPEPSGVREAETRRDRSDPACRSDRNDRVHFRIFHRRTSDNRS